MKKNLLVALVILFCAPLVSIDVFAFADGDFQVWNTEKIEVKINDRLKLTAEEEFKWGDDASNFYYQHTDVGFVYALNKYVDGGLSFRHINEKSKGQWKKEERPHINVTLKTTWQGFKLSDRSRFEYRIREKKHGRWRFRNKVTVKAPWKFTRWDVNPYVADEIFIDMPTGEFTRNRLYLGTGMHIIGPFYGDIYYLWQTTDKKSFWQDVNALGIKLALKF